MQAAEIKIFRAATECLSGGCLLQSLLFVLSFNWLRLRERTVAAQDKLCEKTRDPKTVPNCAVGHFEEMSYDWFSVQFSSEEHRSFILENTTLESETFPSVHI